MHPSLARLLARDRLGSLPKPGASASHLEAAIEWLCRAQDNAGGRGVSAGYSLIDGWLPPYPETTGYIIPTFFDYARSSGREELRERALRMADWEIEVQLPDGSVQAGQYKAGQKERRPAIFNTGQVILGWCRAYAETKKECYLEAAMRAGDWLAGAQAADGSWPLRAPETETTVHAYDVRTAWSLLELNALVNQRSYLEAARLNLQWTLEQQQENGWFKHNAFFFAGNKWDLPLTHTIAYVMEGLQESWRLLGDDRYFQAVYKTAERLLRIFELRRFMPGEFDGSWKTAATYSCLTGDAQIAGVWMKVYETTRDTRFLNAALKLNDYVKSTQSLRASHGGVRGGVKGSQPIFGRYTPFVYVNWAAKFLADSLMLEERLMAAFERAALNGEPLGPGDLEAPSVSVVNR
jgi:uncharacterized protein YyaL (SSP411 family)